MAETPLDPKARAALDAYAARTAEGPGPARLDAVWRSVEAPRRSSRWVWVPALAALAALALVAWPKPPPPPSTPVAETVRLDRGRLDVRPPAGTVRTVVTPQATFVVQQAAAWLEVTPEGTVLSVESGEVVWRTRTRSGSVRAGERATIGEDAPPPPPVPRPTPGLTAEAALYEEAMRAHDAGKKTEALRLFRDHRARFPDGIFAPEVSIGLMLALQRAGDPRAAAEEARAFCARFGSDPRAASIRHWAERLE